MRSDDSLSGRTAHPGPGRSTFLTWLKVSMQRWPGPGYLLVALWIVMFLKEVETISPFVRDVAVKTGSSVAFVLLLIPVLLFPARSAESKDTQEATWLLPLLAGGLVIWALDFLARYFGRFGYHISRSELLLVGALFGACAALGRAWQGQMTPRRRVLFLGFCWAATTLAWIVPLRDFPLHGDRSDMLPLMIVAAKNWLAGKNPYQWFTVGTHQVPLVYLPSLWLPYMPLAVWNLDPRWLTPLAHLGFVCVNWLALRRTSFSGWWGYLLWVTLNPYLFIRHDVHIYLLWPVVAITFWSMWRHRWMLAAVMWGVLLSLRQTLWVLFPFYLLFLLWNQGWRSAFKYGAIAVLTALLTIAPFLVAYPSEFAHGVFSYQRNIAQQVMLQGNWGRISRWASGFSFVPALYFSGLTRYLEPVQLIGIAVMFIAALWRRLGLNGTLQYMSVMLLFLLLLNPLIMTYMYAELLILVAFTALACQDTAGNTAGFSNEPMVRQKPGLSAGKAEH